MVRLGFATRGRALNALRCSVVRRHGGTMATSSAIGQRTLTRPNVLQSPSRPGPLPATLP